jgi:hypothetical protein
MKLRKAPCCKLKVRKIVVLDIEVLKAMNVHKLTYQDLVIGNI